MKKMFLSIALILFAFCVNAQEVPLLMDSNEIINKNNIDDTLNIEEEETDAFGENIKSQPQPSFKPQEQNIKLDTKKSLTDNFKNNSNADIPDKDVEEEETWIGSGLDALKKITGEKKDNPLTKALEQGRNLNKKSNASIFNISGVMLRMTPVQAEASLIKRGYKKVSQKMDIPNFIKWRNEDKCRNNGVIGYERLNNCVVQIARKDKHEYIEQVEYNKFDTKETLHIFLTSNFTGNKIYKITYRTEAAQARGNSAKARYLHNISVYEFWKKINQKYGAPDDKESITWGLGKNHPYLKASTGFLHLEDPALKEIDYIRMQREDQRFINTDVYTF